MTTTKQATRTAAEAYANNQRRIKESMATLAAALKRHEAAFKKHGGSDWSMVGDLDQAWRGLLDASAGVLE